MKEYDQFWTQVNSDEGGASQGDREKNLNPIRCLDNFRKMIELHAFEQTQ